jgi:putative ABC transport system ATP-binding protein
MTAAVRLIEVTKVYGNGPTALTALADVSLAAHSGELVALVGPSGSGKTTLLSIAGALLRPTAGQVLVGGTELTGLTRRAQTTFRAHHIGFVFQGPNLIPFLTARENLEIMGQLAGLGRSERQRRAATLLDDLDLTDRAGHLPQRLSGGQRQRVAVGRALMNDPVLLLADEPTANLDTELGLAVVDLIATQVRRRSAAGLLVTHDARMAARADRVLAIRDGRVQPPRGDAGEATVA